MKFRTFVIAATVAIATAATGFAQLSMAKADWARGPVQYLMTREEKAQWNTIKSDAEADQFIALFWARRDPTPNTPQNEFRDSFEQRVQYADQHLANGRERGSLADRGKILILFGPPTQPVRNVASPQQGMPGTPGTTTNEAEQNAPAREQIWIYDGERAQQEFGTPRVELHFVDQMGNGEYRLETPRVDMAKATEQAVNAAITQPNLTKVPTYQTQQPQPQPAAQPAAPEGPVTTFKTAAFETAVTGAKPAANATISSAQFVAPTGEPYVSTGLVVNGVAADAADTMFGAVTDSTGKRVLAFEEPVTLTASKGGNVFAAKTLELPPGSYTETFGLA